MWLTFLCWSVIWLSNKPAIWSPFSVSANNVGDAFGILNSLVWIITLILLWETYKTQKLELQETSSALREQQKLMDESKFHEYFLFSIQHRSFLKESITKERTSWIRLDSNNQKSETTIIKGEDVFYYWAHEIKDSNLSQDRNEWCKTMFLDWLDSSRENITLYIDFNKIIQDEVLSQNNRKYEKIFETLQSHNEKIVLNYLNALNKDILS